jgi:hypothetical protein
VVTRASLCFAAGLVGAAVACAPIRAGRAREGYLTAQLDALRHDQPLDAVWPEARRLLAERGYPLAGQDAKAVGQPERSLLRFFSPAQETRADEDGARFLETGWGKDLTRYHVDGSPEGARCHVIFTAIAQDPTEHRDAARHRDLELELELARRVDPEAATRIEAGLKALGGGGG